MEKQTEKEIALSKLTFEEQLVLGLVKSGSEFEKKKKKHYQN